MFFQVAVLAFSMVIIVGAWSIIGIIGISVLHPINVALSILNYLNVADIADYLLSYFKLGLYTGDFNPLHLLSDIVFRTMGAYDGVYSPELLAQLRSEIASLEIRIDALKTSFDICYSKYQEFVLLNDMVNAASTQEELESIQSSIDTLETELNIYKNRLYFQLHSHS